jgi:hypothetical protein
MTDELMDTAYRISDNHFIVVRLDTGEKSVTIFRLHEDQLSDWGIVHRVDRWDELTVGRKA